MLTLVARLPWYEAANIVLTDDDMGRDGGCVMAEPVGWHIDNGERGELSAPWVCWHCGATIGERPPWAF